MTRESYVDDFIGYFEKENPDSYKRAFTLFIAHQDDLIARLETYEILGAFMCFLNGKLWAEAKGFYKAVQRSEREEAKKLIKTADLLVWLFRDDSIADHSEDELVKKFRNI